MSEKFIHSVFLKKGGCEQVQSFISCTTSTGEAAEQNTNIPSNTRTSTSTSTNNNSTCTSRSTGAFSSDHQTVEDFFMNDDAHAPSVKI